jgi:hypothetical protein
VKSCALLASFDRDTCSWKTLQQSFLTDSEPFSQTWPRWGMTQDGAAYEHPMSGRRITETGGSVWQTMTVSCAEHPGQVKHKAGQQMRLTMQVNNPKYWPKPAREMFATPNTLDSMPPKSPEALHREATVTRPGRSKPANLRDQVTQKYWPTPTVTTGAQVAWNKTPGQTGGTSLSGAVKMWPTPTNHNHKETGAPSQLNRNTVQLGDMVGGQLSPDWVSWLMNFPIGWAATHDIMGFNSKESKNANAKEGNADSALCELRESVGKETIQFSFGGLDSIQEKEILRSGLHGESHNSGKCDLGRVEESFHEVSSEEMQRLWDAGEFACSPHGQQPGEQRPGELEDALRFMPCEMALGEREGFIEDGEEMQALRQTSEKERALQHSCEPDVSARESANGSWWDIEPNIGRVATGVKNRVGQLKGYGNAQVPLQAAAAWRLLRGDR